MVIVAAFYLLVAFGVLLESDSVGHWFWRLFVALAWPVLLGIMLAEE